MMSCSHSMGQKKFHWSFTCRIWPYVTQLVKDQQKSKADDIRLEPKASLLMRKNLQSWYVLMHVFIT